MKKLWLLLACACLTQALALAQDTYQFYVSPTGSDAADGRLDRPFATLERARQAVRALKKAGPLKKPVTVNLRGGTYPIARPLVFGPEDSGTETCPVTYRAYQNEKVLFHGGKVIKGWQPYKNNIWVASLPEVRKGKWQFRQLFVNGGKRPRARFPNQGFYRVQGFPDGGPDMPYHTDVQRFEYRAGDLSPKWRNLDEVEVIVYHFWTDSHLPIQAIDPQTRIVTFKHKAGKRFTDDFTRDGARYIVENVWEGLDAPGEWYLDKKKGQLYYYPQPGEDMRQVEVVAPVTPAFIRLAGQPLAGRPVAYLRFQGLAFAYTNWDLPAGNSNDAQGSAGVPASISLEGAHHNSFQNCQLQHTGTFGFDLLAGSQHNQISHCTLSQLGGGGIRLNGGKPDEHPLLHTSHNQVRDNAIGYFGREFPSAVGVMVMHASHNEVSHNEIHHGYYTGVSVGMVWGYTRSAATHNRIAYNHIHHIGEDSLLSDMGGIYTLGVSPGTVLQNNVVHDINANHYGGWGIYLDEGSSYILVKDNIVYNTKFGPFNIHFSKEVQVRNNIFALGRLEQLSRSKVEPHISVYFENNIVYWKTGPLFHNNWRDIPYTAYVSAFGESKPMRSTFEADYNLYFNPGAGADTTRFNGLTWAEWQQAGKDRHSLWADPLFVDGSRFDFRLQPGSPALQLGFTPIDVRRVGIRKKEEE